MRALVKREKVIDARTSADSGTAAVATVEQIDGYSLAEFDEFTAYLDVETELDGTSPAMDLYLQRAVVADPDPSTDGHWEDFYAFPQVTTSTVERVVDFPLPNPQDVDGSLGTASRARAVESLAADTLLSGHPGDKIRIVEKMGGTVTQEAVYDITLVGRRRSH